MRDASNLVINPFEEKTIGKLTFTGVVAEKQEALARIKYRFEGETEIGTLIIPVEVKIKAGIYFRESILDFGIVTPQKPKATLPLSI